MTIPASNIVKINPAVIGGGGNGLDLNGLLVTNTHAVPVGSVQTYTSARAVGDFFGSTSAEKSIADVYFDGYTGSTKTPGKLLIARQATGNVAAHLRGGSMAGVTLAQLKAMTGTITLTVDGTEKNFTTGGEVNLATADSFSDVAAIITNVFDGDCVVTYDTQRQAFLFTSATTGAASTITFATGMLSDDLKLTAATGAMLSQGAVSTSAADTMDAIIDQTQNWAAFMLTYATTVEAKEDFAAWTNLQNKRWLFVAVDSNLPPAVDGGDSRTLAQRLFGASINDGTAIVYREKLHAAFVLAVTASIDFERANGRITYAFKMQDGLIPSVTTKTQADELTAAGLNFIGAYATANDGFTFFSPGAVLGEYRFIDEYVNQIWLNNALQLAMMQLLAGVPSVPYTAAGYGLIEAACMDPINQAVNFGAIRAGVPLSELQKVQVNNAAGTPIDKVLSTRGWYLQILPATAQVRAARGTPPMSFWYMDGGAVQSIEMASIVVQ